MDSQRDDGSVNPTRAADGATHTDHITGHEIVGYDTEVGRYRRPLLAAPVPWIAGLILVPALLAGLGMIKAAPAPAATKTPSVAAAPVSTPTPGTPEAAAANAVLEVSQDGKTVSVSGSVPDAATQKAVVDAVKAAYGSSVTVADRLKVTAGAPAVDAAAFGTVASALKGIQGVIFDIQGGNVRISGAAPDDAAKEAVLAAIKAAYPSAKITDTGLAVGDASTPPASCDATGNYVKVVTAQTKIQFASGGAKLTADSVAALGKIADAVKKCPGTKLEVAGNTDSSGSAAGNKTLSEKRATEVKAQLVALGLDPASITTVGNGETKPIASNDTVAGQATNRRVDITVQ